MKRNLAILITVALMLGIILPAGCIGSGASFADENLEAAVREVLLKKPGESLTTADLEKITEISAYDLEISDLRGIEQCTNLEILKLWSNQISDLSPLKDLTN
jgi:Leucine-rich repeat (LRR) protein